MKKAGLILVSTLILGACASPAKSPDDMLAMRVKQQIAQTDGANGAKSVNVQAANGVVILSGYIGTPQQKYEAAQTALKVDGVKTVFDNMNVVKTESSGQ